MEEEEEEESCFEGCMIHRWYFCIFNTLSSSSRRFPKGRPNDFTVIVLLF